MALPMSLIVPNGPRRRSRSRGRPRCRPRQTPTARASRPVSRARASSMIALLASCLSRPMERSIICLPLVVNRNPRIVDPMPRPYNLGQRAAPKAETRARIVAAALAIYRDRGLAGASNLAIARAADVAPATVRNHFPEPGDLRARGLRGAARRAPDPDAGDLRGPRRPSRSRSNGSPGSSPPSTSGASRGGAPTSGSRS